MAEAFDPHPAAAMLAEAWRGGTLLAELPQALRPATMAEGYDIQDRLIVELGRPVVGWKLGLGSAVQKRQSGVGRSIAGRVLGSHLHRPGAEVRLPNAAPVTVEFEIAYVLGRDIRPDEAEFPVIDAVAEVRAAFELVLSRFVNRRTVGWPSFAAATDPAGALAYLVATARERGMTLPKGSVISTGTVSKPFDIAAPTAEISARFLGTELGFRTRADLGNGTQS
jgi:2-keto-4-pentenoate hydratase